MIDDDLLCKIQAGAAAIEVEFDERKQNYAILINGDVIEELRHEDFEFMLAQNWLESCAGMGARRVYRFRASVVRKFCAADAARKLA